MPHRRLLSTRRRRHGRRLALQTALAALAVLTLATSHLFAATAVSAAAGVDATARVSPSAPAAAASSLWMVSSRHLGGCDGELRVWRCQDCRWEPSDMPSLLASDDPAVPTVIYAHGNWESEWDAKNRSFTIFNRLGQYVEPGQPFRMIAFSWPSAKIRGGLRKDAQTKAWRAEMHAHHLARFVDQINPEVRLSLMGFSFGARMVTGALHLLGGGELYGRVLDQRVHPDRPGVHAVLLAAALDSHWLYPGRHHGQAMTQVVQLTNVWSCCDDALKWYPLMYCGGGPEALGYVGLNRWHLGQYADRYVPMQVSCLIGCDHTWCNFAANPNILLRVEEELVDGATVTVETNEGGAQLAPVRSRDGAEVLEMERM